jgi:hypothetical protein
MAMRTGSKAGNPRPGAGTGCSGYVKKAAVRAAAISAATSRFAFESLERRTFLSSDPVINEFLANNKTGLTAADGSHPDWIEIYNPGSTAVDLAGWTITDKDVNAITTLFTFPSTNAGVTTVAAGGYKVIFCDSKSNPINAAGEIHTNFNIDKAGGSLILARPDSIVTSAFDPYPSQITDVSYGPGPAGVATTPVLTTPVSVTVKVPTDSTLGTSWTQPGFDDSSWTAGTSGVGFENLGGNGNPPALPTEIEPNDTAGTANDSSTNFVAQPSSNVYHLGIKGNISAATDVDYYKIGAMQVGDILSISASGSPGSRGTDTDLHVDLYRGSNPSSLALVTSDEDGGPGLDALIDRFAIAANDTYYVKVSTATSKTGTYDLGLYLENTSTAPTTGGTITAETESNNTGSTANDISTSWRHVQYLSHTTASSSGASAVDYFKYKFTAGDLVTINVDSTGSQHMKATLYNSTGTTVIALEDGTSTRASPYNLDSEIYSFIIPTTGVYYVKATGVAAGPYNMDVYLSTTTPPPLPGASSLYTGLINTDVGGAMQNVNASAYVRVPFSIADPTQVSTLTLSMKYEDGFVAYINGTEVARVNAGGTVGTPLAYNATAASDRSDSLATTFSDFDISAFASSLVLGQNVLAIQALNDAPANGRFLVVPELRFTTVTPAGMEYFTTPTPGAANIAGNLGQVKDTKFSVKRGFYEAPFDVAITTSTSGATIRYTLDGSAPTATHGIVYTAPIHISGMTVLRAAAFKPGFLPTNVDTESYMFLADVQTQTVPSSKYPASSYPATWAGDQGIGGVGLPSGSYPADYNINPAIVNPAAGSSWTNADFMNGLLQIPTVSIVTDPANLFAPPVIQNSTVVGGGIYQLPQEEGDAWEMPASVEMFSPDGSTLWHENVGLRTQGAASRQNSKQPKHNLRILFKSQYGAPTLSYPIFGPGSDGTDTIDFRGTYNDSWTHTLSTAPTDNQRNIADYIRDGWNRLTQAAMGDLGLHQQFVQLYINGLYWGLYDATNRPESSYYAQYLGGNKDDYEVVNAGTSVDSPAANPNLTANDWAALNTMINQTTVVNGVTVPYVSTPDGYTAIRQILDVGNLADYIVQNVYAGNNDWDNGHNFYAYKNSTIPGDGWKFICWDSERTIEGVNDNVIGTNNAGGPSRMFHQLITNPEFVQLLADRAHKFLFNNGALTPGPALARYQPLVNQITQAIVGESARWGNYEIAYRNIGTQLFTKDNWTAATNNNITNWFPARTGIVIQQLKNAGLYPSTDAPEYSQFGGSVPVGYQLGIINSASNISAGGGTIYYTLDGSDPRLPGGAVAPGALMYDPNNPPVINGGVEVQARVLLNGLWSALTDARFFTAAPPALRVSEIMYHPGSPPAGSPYSSDDFEFLELQNTGATTIALADFNLSNGISFTFPKGLPDLQPGQYTLVVHNLAAFQSIYGTSLPVAGQYGGDLSNTSDEITLTSPFGQPIEDFVYQSSWYPDTNGDGYSLVAIDPSATNAALSTAAGWRPSSYAGGAPAAADPGINPGSVVINEVLSNSTGIASGDWVELKNTTAAPIDIGNWFLSDSSGNLRKYTIPTGTIIPADGFATFTQTANFGAAFTLADAGGSIFLSEGDVSGNLLGYRDTEDFGATDPGVTHGRYIKSTGDVDFPQLSAATFGADNAYPRVGPIVINEMMYDPLTGGDEWIELQNITTSDVNLYDPANPANTWQFTDGVAFTFPQNVTIPAGAYALVVPIDPATFRSKYNIPASVQIFGPYNGALNNGGESVKLSRPGTPIGGVVPYITIDHVNYNNAAPWPPPPHGTGPSLARIASNSYGNDPINWTSGPAGGTPGLINFPAVVTGRSVFYNGSSYDGGDPGASSADDNAIATDKTALLPGQSSSSANFTTFFHGLNGVMVDITGLANPAAIGAGDFTFTAGNTADPSTWTAAPAPTSVSVRGNRITMIWPDNAIQNEWLQVTVKADANTGLATNDVFYFGNLIGDANGNGNVTVADIAQTKSQSGQPATITSNTDFNRNGTVSVADTAIAKAFQGNSLVPLTPPLAASPPAPEASAAVAAPMAISIAAPSAPLAQETPPTAAAAVITAPPVTNSHPAMVATAPPVVKSANGHRASRRTSATSRKRSSSLLARLLTWVMG